MWRRPFEMFIRDFLAGISAMYATPMYSNIGRKSPLQWASTILGWLAIFVTIPIYVFNWQGPRFVPVASLHRPWRLIVAFGFRVCALCIFELLVCVRAS